MMAGKAASMVHIISKMEQKAEASFVRGWPVTKGGLASGFKDFESRTWQPTGSTSSPWADKKSKPRMGLETVRVGR